MIKPKELILFFAFLITVYVSIYFGVIMLYMWWGK